jgi:hypothetical protein
MCRFESCSGHKKRCNGVTAQRHNGGTKKVLLEFKSSVFKPLRL